MGGIEEPPDEPPPPPPPPAMPSQKELETDVKKSSFTVNDQVPASCRMVLFSILFFFSLCRVVGLKSEVEASRVGKSGSSCCETWFCTTTLILRYLLRSDYRCCHLHQS